MPTQAERTAALETHYEHVDKTLTVMSGTLDAIRSEVAELRDTVRAEIADVRTMVRTRKSRRFARISTAS